MTAIIKKTTLLKTIFAGTIVFASILFCIVGIINIRDNFAAHYKVVRELENISFVSDVRSWRMGSLLVNWWWAAQVTLQDGGRISITGINPQGKQSGDVPELISSVNNYFFFFYNRTYGKEGRFFGETFEFWSSIIGVPVETVVDIVKNYHIISSVVEGWTVMYDYKQNDEPRMFTIHRILDNALYSEVIIFGYQEIIPLRYSLSQRWRWSTAYEQEEIRQLFYKLHQKWRSRL